MTIAGRVQNGVVIPQGNCALPEGAVVSISYPATSPQEDSSNSTSQNRRIQVPLVRTGEPGSVRLTNQQIADVLDDEDAPS